MFDFRSAMFACFLVFKHPYDLGFRELVLSEIDFTLMTRSTH